MGSTRDAPCDLLGHAPVRQAQHDNVDTIRQFDDIGDEPGTRRVPPGSGDVVADDIVARSHEVGRQDAAHVAEADETNGRHGHPSFWSSARSARSAFLAETPAGAPQ